MRNRHFDLPNQKSVKNSIQKVRELIQTESVSSSDTTYFNDCTGSFASISENNTDFLTISDSSSDYESDSDSSSDLGYVISTVGPDYFTTTTMMP